MAIVRVQKPSGAFSALGESEVPAKSPRRFTGLKTHFTWNVRLRVYSGTQRRFPLRPRLRNERIQLLSSVRSAKSSELWMARSSE